MGGAAEPNALVLMILDGWLIYEGGILLAE
jgi:hypothetical protein